MKEKKEMLICKRTVKAVSVEEMLKSKLNHSYQTTSAFLICEITLPLNINNDLDDSII